ncbi:hypothetical protein P353_16695 [Comamonas testosteroni]|uniref:Alcohol dehydrogenase n=2 Tax=Comamonas testosteroni TaxID=285 RepID=A0A096FD74_COMTE|nr:hypothetical protein P353_16695 [Comamonas testosteroni]
MFLELLRAMEQHNIKTLEAETFPFDKAAEAYTFFDKARHIGKVFIQRG